MELYDFFKENDFTSVRKTLVLRSGRMWQVRMAIESLKVYAPDTRVDVLCQPSALEDTAALPYVDRVIAYPAERILLRNTPLRLIRQIRGEGYDLVLIVLNTKGLEKYESIFRLTVLLGAKKRCRYSPFCNMWFHQPFFFLSWRYAIIAAPFIVVIAGIVTLLYPLKTVACFLFRNIFGGRSHSPPPVSG